jgi:hypothetical protein
MDANTEEIMNATQESLDANLKDLREEIKSGQTEMRSIICTFRSELKETIQHEIKAAIHSVRSELNEMTACNEATETEPNQSMIQFIEEHQEIPKEDAAVISVRGPRKRRRVCSLAAERRQKMRERTRGNRGSRRKSTAACRKLSRRAKVA